MIVPWFFKSNSGSTILVLPQRSSKPALMIRPSGEQSHAFVENMMLKNACAVKLNGEFHIFDSKTVNNQIQ